MTLDLREIEVKLGRASTLPLLPDVALKVLRMTEDHSASVRDYERIIAVDPAITTKILRTANSAAYNGSGQHTTLRTALQRLGVSTIRSICLTVSFQSTVLTKSMGSGFDAGAYWQHSMGVACGAKLLAHLKKSPLTEQAFVAGLLHDIGKLALAMFLPAEAAMVRRCQTGMSPAPSDYEAEEQVIGVTHQDIGRMVAEKWKLPEIFLEPISSHHHPMKDGLQCDDITVFVHTANALAYRAGLCSSPAGTTNATDPAVLDYLGLPDEQYDRICTVLNQEINSIGMQMAA